MLKKLLLILFFMPLLGFDTGDKYLEKISPYQNDSYFKSKVYGEHNWKSFSAMKEANTAIDPDNYDMHLLNAAIFFSTNKIRESKKEKPFHFSAALRDAAVIHTDEMIDKKIFNHFNNLSPKLRTPEQRMKICGLTATEMAENIDLNFIDAKQKTTYWQLAETIVDALYHSPPHRKNILDKSLTHLGCAGIFETKDKGTVRYVKATQDFSN